jgi:phospholipid/cholesterol/gamma-HCH transport system substrate-binding protein
MKLSNEARIGIAVLAAAALFIAAVMYLRGIDLRAKQYSLTVLYDNVSGLQSDDIVTVGGLAIGYVESMTLVGRSIAVNLSVKTKVQLPRDSKAVLKSETIMGGKFIEISPGIDSVVLLSGDTLAGVYEADLSELTATLAPISSNVLGILENVNSTFDEPTRMRIQMIVEELASSAVNLDELIRLEGARTDQALTDFGIFAYELSRFAKRLDTLAVSQRENIDTSITAFTRMAQNFDRVSGRMDSTTVSLNYLLTQLRNGEGTLGKLIHDRRLYDNLDSLSVNLNLLARDLRVNPHRYVKVSIF